MNTVWPFGWIPDLATVIRIAYSDELISTNDVTLDVRRVRTFAQGCIVELHMHDHWLETANAPEEMADKYYGCSLIPALELRYPDDPNVLVWDLGGGSSDYDHYFETVVCWNTGELPSRITFAVIDVKWIFRGQQGRREILHKVELSQVLNLYL